MRNHETKMRRSFTLLVLLALFGAPLVLRGGARADHAKPPADTKAPSFIGVWEVVADGKDKFTLTLKQSRRGLYGTITPGNGQAVGRAYDGVLQLRCYQDEKLKNTAQLKLSDDGKTFTGTSKTEGDEQEHSWSGTRQ